MNTETQQTEDRRQMFERHYSVRVLSELWGYSEDTIQDWFRDEPGVLKQETKQRRGRGKCTLRIPESVAWRVYKNRTKK
jgi:hypothetical protein